MRSLLSRLPAWVPGGALLTRPAASSGATPMLPKKGCSGSSMLSENFATLRFVSSGMIFIEPLAKSSGVSTPLRGLKLL